MRYYSPHPGKVVGKNKTKGDWKVAFECEDFASRKQIELTA